MSKFVLLLIPLAFCLSFPLTLLVRALSHRLRAHDTEAIAGQVKAARRRVPNTGGIAVVLAFVLPVLLGLGAIAAGGDWLPASIQQHRNGILQETPLAILLVGCLLALHILGLIDDRRPLGPWLKLAIMALPALAVPIVTTFARPLFDGHSETRLLTLLDAHAGGPWLSIIVTALWFLVVTNAMNFMDNMDGLSGGVGVVASSCFLAAALLQGQWFVGACLALLIGSLLGFLAFNFPLRRPASIFMGDGGSLVIGFLLALLTARTTYYEGPATITAAAQSIQPNHWYGVFMPLIILAIPLYDFTTVVLIRLSQGKSPFVGDLQHLSHRMCRRGLSQRAAVIAICGFTAVTGANGVFLNELPPMAAVFAGVQTLFVLGVVALIEYAATPDRQPSPKGGNPP